MKPASDRDLMIAFAMVAVAIIGLALTLGLAWRVFTWTAGV